MVLKSELLAAVQGRKPARSAWDRGVQAYAADLCENLANDTYVPDVLPETWADVRKAMLNGADSWLMYSWGGCALVYDGDIAERLCTPSELRRSRNGDRAPNGRETWLDVQARALREAAVVVCREFERLAAGAAGAGKANG